MKIVYIAHPIGGDVKRNIWEITQIIRQINLTRSDVVPFAPYMGDVLALVDSIPKERERGLQNCMEVLKRGFVDELWIYGEKISDGMLDEIEMAINLNIPVVLMDPRTCCVLEPGMKIGY